MPPIIKKSRHVPLGKNDDSRIRYAKNLRAWNPTKSNVKIRQPVRHSGFSGTPILAVVPNVLGQFNLTPQYPALSSDIAQNYLIWKIVPRTMLPKPTILSDLAGSAINTSSNITILEALDYRSSHGILVYVGTLRIWYAHFQNADRFYTPTSK